MTSRANSSITSDIICRQLLESIILHRIFCFLVGVFEVFTGVNDAFDHAEDHITKGFQKAATTKAKSMFFVGKNQLRKEFRAQKTDTLKRAYTGYVSWSFVHRRSGRKSHHSTPVRREIIPTRM